MSARKQRRQLAQWAAATRAQAHERARTLALQIVGGQPTGATAYDIGVVLQPGENLFARSSGHMQTNYKDSGWVDCGLIDWAITSYRIVGRFPATGEMEDVQWKDMAAVRADLAAEWLALNAHNGWRAVITGPGIAPIVVAAIASCHGAQALIDHPAIAPLRAQVRFPTTATVAPVPAAIENTASFGQTF